MVHELFFIVLLLSLIKCDSLRMSVTGQVFVCTNKWCRDKGSDATMATFSFLTPPSVQIVSVNCLGRCNRGPNCRILNSNGAFVEASMVRSVESVVDLLQDHLNLKVNITSAEVLRLNYEGNVHLRNGEVDEAIACYDKALLLRDKEQEGVLLVMRGTALLQRAYICRMRHKDILSIAQFILPDINYIRLLLEVFTIIPPPIKYYTINEAFTRVHNIFTNVEMSPRWNEAKSRLPEGIEANSISTGNELLSKAMFLWSLYEHALTGALEDLLSATLVMPGFAQAWRRAGDALADLKQFNAAIEYYEVAMRLDSNLESSLISTVEKLKLMKKIELNALENGYPVDAILALVDD